MNAKERENLSDDEVNNMKEYQLVTMNGETGDWEPPFDTVYADSDEKANAYAEEHYPDTDSTDWLLREWYILDEDGDNING